MDLKKLVSVYQSPLFRKVSTLLGIAFLIISIIISTKPEPFLRFGYLGVFAFNLFGSGTILVPVLARHMNLFLLVFISAVAAAINEIISWMVGYYGRDFAPPSPKVLKIEENLQKYGPPMLLVWALIPFPYDFVGIAAGYLGLSIKSFIAFTFIGRFLRFLLLGLSILQFFGPAV